MINFFKLVTSLLTVDKSYDGVLCDFLVHVDTVEKVEGVDYRLATVCRIYGAE
jgi:hypothetical protein